VNERGAALPAGTVRGSGSSSTTRGWIAGTGLRPACEGRCGNGWPSGIEAPCISPAGVTCGITCGRACAKSVGEGGATRGAGTAPVTSSGGRGGCCGASTPVCSAVPRGAGVRWGMVAGCAGGTGVRTGMVFV
jgi:hypothetical protein